MGFNSQQKWQFCHSLLKGLSLCFMCSDQHVKYRIPHEFPSTSSLLLNYHVKQYTRTRTCTHAHTHTRTCTHTHTHSKILHSRNSTTTFAYLVLNTGIAYFYCCSCQFLKVLQAMHNLFIYLLLDILTPC